MKIGVFGHYGNQNLGDEAIITAVIQNIQARYPDAQITAFSVNPDDSEKRHGVPAFPIRRLVSQNRPQNKGSVVSNTHDQKTQVPLYSKWLTAVKAQLKKIAPLYSLLKTGSQVLQLPVIIIRELGFLRRAYRALKGFDLLMIAGSGQLFDGFGGPGDFPYTLAKWAVLAKLCRTRLAIVSVGAGPIDSGLSKVLLRICLSLADYVSFRDEGSRQLIESIGFRGKGAVLPDLAHGLDLGIEASPTRINPSGNGHPTVGINPLPYYDHRYWDVSDPEKYAHYVRKLAAFAASLLKEGYPIFFFGTQTMDNLVIEDVLTEVGKEMEGAANMHGLVAPNNSVAELIGNLKAADIIVATRFHGAVLSLLFGTPVIGLYYQKKTHEIMTDTGQADYSFDMSRFETADLIKGLKELQTVRDRQMEIAREKERDYRDRLARQYDAVFALLNNG